MQQYIAVFENCYHAFVDLFLLVTFLKTSNKLIEPRKYVFQSAN